MNSVVDMTVFLHDKAPESPLCNSRGPLWLSCCVGSLSEEFHGFLYERMHVAVIIDERHHLAVFREDLLNLP